MSSPEEVSIPPHAAELLRSALEAQSPEQREALAREGLARPDEELCDDTRALLLRQLYRALLDTRQLRQAAEAAEEMSRIGPLKDVAHHDASRAWAALGDLDAAIAQQRLAARSAPVTRRSFHYWCLGTLLHFAGDHEAAVSALVRGERWARDDRPLLRAHRAYVLLDAGEGVPGLAEILQTLASSEPGGYGQYLLGSIYAAMGDDRRAATHLRTFLRRNAAIDDAKALTLREELRRARLLLARIESD